MKPRILVILGHPDGASFCGALAEAYAKGAREAGAEVDLLRLGDLDFDPVLRKGYREVQLLEPDLLEAQERVTWAQHLVFVYPTWWGARGGCWSRRIRPRPTTGSPTGCPPCGWSGRPCSPSAA